MYYVIPKCYLYGSLNWVIIGLDDGLLSVRCQAIIYTNSGLLLTGILGILGTNFSEFWSN